MAFNNSTFHFPPELLSLLIQTIPLLCRSKKDVLLFFRGAGTNEIYIADLMKIVKTNKESITKYEITERILTRLNEQGDKELAVRREILKRIVEFDSFSSCWEGDILKAKGCVAEVRDIVNIKDSFTRMNIEREKSQKEYALKQQQERQAVNEYYQKYDDIKERFYKLFAEQNPQARGKMLEDILNDLFSFAGIGVKESFTVSADDVGVYEQIDGAVEIDGAIYLVEMKWRKDTIDVNDVSRHLVRMFSRHDGKGIFISYSNYSEAAIQTCRESLSKATIVLCTLQEIVLVMEKHSDILDFFKQKIQGAVLHKNPFTPYGV